MGLRHGGAGTPLAASHAPPRRSPLHHRFAEARTCLQIALLGTLRRPFRKASSPALPLPPARRHGAWEAALAQELDLFGRCSSAVVYRNLAARTNATQWQPEQQPGQQQAAHPPAAQPEAPTPQQGQEAEAQAAEQRKEAQQPQQAEQPASDEHPPGQQGAAAAVGQKQAQASRQLQLEEVDIEWEAALPDSLAEQSAGPAAAAGSSRGSQAPAAAGAAPSTSRTELGTGKFTPLSAGHPSGTAPKLGGAAEPGGKAATADAEPAAAPEAGGQPAQSTPQGTAVQAEAGLSETGVGAAPGSVRQQVELFIRAELHPLLRRRHISQELHDAGMQGSAAWHGVSCGCWLLALPRPILESMNADLLPSPQCITSGRHVRMTPPPAAPARSPRCACSGCQERRQGDAAPRGRRHGRFSCV